MRTCTCAEHPAFPGVPSDERWDDPSCKVHHPEKIVAKRFTIEAEVEGSLYLSEAVKGYVKESELLGFDSQKLAALVKADPGEWLQHDGIEWTVWVCVDDDAPVEFKVQA